MQWSLKNILLSILVVMVPVGAYSPVIEAGSLEPSAPPGPTMKTLDEVEPRIPIKGLPLTISNPGSYYLTQDLSTSNVGIIVDTDNVTIDLMGFSLIGPNSGSTNGIHLQGHANIEIRNGTVRNFGGFGIYGRISGKLNRVINVRALSNGSRGISLQGNGHLIKDCTASENDGIGIYAGPGSTVTGNTVYNNLSSGIATNRGTTVTGNTAYYNQEDGISAYYGSTVTGNTVYYNTENGIGVSSNCIVTENTVYYNNLTSSVAFAGISVSTDCLVKGNVSSNNFQNNIYVAGSDNAIEENLVTDSSNGIYFNSTGNFYDNNRASGNTVNYANITGNTHGGGNYSF